MKLETLTEHWRSELRRIEKMGIPSPIPSTRRFWKDEFHAYGWQVGFKETVRFADGQTARISFTDIGTDRNAAIGNALRYLDSGLAAAHPACQLLLDEIQAREAIIKPFKARISQWRAGWFKKPVSDSVEKLSVKFHAMRRAATDENHRPSRKLCTSLAYEVHLKTISYSDAIAKIIAAGGKA